MQENIDTDPTLPSVVASLPGRYREQELLLTIVFHPRTARIGQAAVVPATRAVNPWILGRRGPVFAGKENVSAGPLEDLHVSRQALEFLRVGERLVIRKLATSSRCRVAGSELADSIELDEEQLRIGVPLLLGHSVVLLLRLGHYPDATTGMQAGGELLRGNSACMARLREQVAEAALSDLDVLVRGETGTGKELVATAIHAASRRSDAPMVSVNMAAIPGDLAAAALFGSARGAFTGADRAAPGYFQQAQGGSLFLDEIGDAATTVQPQLLRALQQREIQSVGGPLRRVDLRVISATDAALEGAACDFRAALRHRLGACEIVLLPLREHPEDIGELLLHFLVASASAQQRTGLLPHEHSTNLEIAAWAGLFYSFVSYRWPGNVRELANFAQQVVMSSGRQLTLADNLQALLDTGAAPPRTSTVRSAHRKMREVDEAEFESALQAHYFEATGVARELGVSRTSVYRRISRSPRRRLASEVPVEELQRVLAQHRGDSTAATMQLRVSLSSLRTRLRELNLEFH